jgi:hypothetical protein
MMGSFVFLLNYIMTKTDERLIEASIHYAIAECGRLTRISTPYKMDKRTKMGVGFEYIDAGGYYGFNHNAKKELKSQAFKSHRMIYYLHHGDLPETIDHIDHNKLNNKVSNLRGCSQHQNTMNTSPRKNSSSKYLGVGWDKVNRKWRSRIKHTNLGRFTCEKEAARAYNKAALEHYGEFANLNKIKS